MKPPKVAPHFRRAAVLVFVALAACSEAAGPSDEPITELPRELTVAERSVIAASNGFGLELVRRVAVSDDRANVILSPLSASMALGMTLNGAESTTFDAMRTTLGFDSLTQEQINQSYRDLIDLLTGLDPRVRFDIANAIWADEDVPFHDAFFEAVEASFDAAAESRDFGDPATVQRINDWVSEHTAGFIDTIVEQLDPALVMLLVNAIYLDAEWTLQFDPDDTRPADFTREDASTVTIDLMSLDDPTVGFTATEEYSAVELAYGGEAFSMVVMLPAQGATVRDLLDALDGQAWAELTESLGEVELGRVALPKFTLTYDTWLNDALKGMGMEVAFGSDADFSRLSPLGDQMCISWVRQKSFIEVDERGTRAAAVTAVGVGTTSAPPSFVADRPFAFAIRERLSGTLLFMGIVGDPTADDPGPGPVASDCG